MHVGDTELEVLDAQIIYHLREAADVGLDTKAQELLVADLARLALECVGVDGALWHGEPNLCATATERYPGLFRGIAYFPDPELPDIPDQLARVKEHPGLVGVRLTPGWPPTGENVERLRAGAYDPWFAELERLDLTLCFFVLGILPDVPAVAEAHPNLRILIDHVGLSPVPQVPLVPERFDALPDLLALSRYENVAVKFTGVPSLSGAQFPFADLWPICRQMLEAFGPERLMWGSDFRRVLPLGVPYW
jgi:L-fuconolactonase